MQTDARNCLTCPQPEKIQDNGPCKGLGSSYARLEREAFFTATST